MGTAGRLLTYGAALIAVFGIAFGAASVLAPDDLGRAASSPATDEHGHSGETDPGDSADSSQHASDQARGVAVAEEGYLLGSVAAPAAVGASADLSFTIFDPDGEALTAYTTAHERDLHLIVVREDGSHFRHVHPVLDGATGVWSVPWSWAAAGTYRVLADFVPAARDAETSLALARTVHVAGDLRPEQPSVVIDSTVVDGFEVSVRGDLQAGASSELELTVTRDGDPVTTLEPYLGAFGHLVALRDGDLAYLHVHAEGAAPSPGTTAGPTITFVTEAPTAGRYLLYLDFQVAGTVHTAAFVLEAAPGGAA